MDPNTRALVMGAAGAASGPALLSHPLLFPITTNLAGNVFVHGIRTNGTVVGTYQLPNRTSYQYPYHGFFCNPYLVIYSSQGGTAYVIDCNDMTLKGTLNFPSTGLYPWSNGQYITVNAKNNSISIYDIPNLTNVLTLAYDSDAGYGSSAGALVTVGFADNGANLFSSLQNRYWWSIGGPGSSSYSTFYYYANKQSATSLGTRSSGYDAGGNYSRQWALSFSQANAVLCSLGNQFFTVSSTSSSPTERFPGSWSYAGYTYYPSGIDSDESLPRCTTTSGGLYISSYSYLSSYDVRFRVGYYANFASGGTSAVDCGIDLRAKTQSPGGLYYDPSDGSFMCQINTSSYVAAIYPNVAGYGADTNQFQIQILNGSSNVTTVNTSVSTAYTGGNSTSTATLSLNGCNWTTNLLYSGTAFN